MIDQQNALLLRQERPRLSSLFLGNLRSGVLLQEKGQKDRLSAGSFEVLRSKGD